MPARATATAIASGSNAPGRPQLPARRPQRRARCDHSTTRCSPPRPTPVAGRSSHDIARHGECETLTLHGSQPVGLGLSALDRRGRTSTGLSFGGCGSSRRTMPSMPCGLPAARVPTGGSAPGAVDSWRGLGGDPPRSATRRSALRRRAGWRSPLMPAARRCPGTIAISVTRPRSRALFVTSRRRTADELRHVVGFSARWRIRRWTGACARE